MYVVAKGRATHADPTAVRSDHALTPKFAFASSIWKQARSN